MKTVICVMMGVVLVGCLKEPPTKEPWIVVSPSPTPFVKVDNYLHSGSEYVLTCESPQAWEEARECEHHVFDCSAFAAPVSCQRDMISLCKIVAG